MCFTFRRIVQSLVLLDRISISVVFLRVLVSDIFLTGHCMYVVYLYMYISNCQRYDFGDQLILKMVSEKSVFVLFSLHNKLCVFWFPLALLFDILMPRSWSADCLILFFSVGGHSFLTFFRMVYLLYSAAHRL